MTKSQPETAKWLSFSVRLRDELDELERLSEQLLDASGIEYRGDFNRNGGLILISRPDWAWTTPSDELRRIQMKLVPRFDDWREHYNLLFRSAPEELRGQVEETINQVRAWIARDGHGWDELPSDIAKAKAEQAERFAKLRHLLEVVAPGSGVANALIALPDTNVLIDTPDLGQYARMLGVSSIDLFLVPATLSELDSLKNQGKHQELREKARRAGREIRKVLERGSIHQGVEIEGGVRVFSRPREPRFDGLPGHLDPSVPDDRLLAAAFELQREHPTAAVVLVTKDVNLQTKAELARIPFAEPPADAGGSSSRGA